MTKTKDTSPLIVGNITPIELVKTAVKQIRVILNKEFHEIEELIPNILSPILGDPTRN